MVPLVRFQIQPTISNIFKSFAMKNQMLDSYGSSKILLLAEWGFLGASLEVSLNVDE